MNKNLDLQLESFKLKLNKDQILIYVFIVSFYFSFYQFYSIIFSIIDNWKKKTLSSHIN